MEKLIFDMDGTLADSMKTWTQTLVDLLNEHKVSYPDNLLDIIAPQSLTQSAIYFREALGMKIEVSEILKLIDDRMVSAFATFIPLKENALKMLNALKERGYSLNILTASPHRILDRGIERWGIAPLFDNIWSCEDLGLPKNTPDIYLRVAELLGVRPEQCRMYDDNINALRASHEAGLVTVGVYDYVSRDNEKAIRSFCDGYIYNFAELI